MIQLDYRTDNPAHGISGIKFSRWDEYALTLGYLSNIRHYRNGTLNGSGLWDGTLELKIEGNDQQGAWGKEGRIQYYGSNIDISRDFVDLYQCRSAGVGNVTLRFNSNNYISSLIQDFGFTVRAYQPRTTCDVFPPNNNAYSSIRKVLSDHLLNEVESILDKFDEGWNK